MENDNLVDKNLVESVSSQPVSYLPPPPFTNKLERTAHAVWHNVRLDKIIILSPASFVLSWRLC
ncbi:MAG: hypothetical protein HC875_14300 [Anaerolineales bacterium]|nr:hypothetical protein [Anaerolineales bacterium]